MTNRQDCRFARPQVARSVAHTDVRHELLWTEQDMGGAVAGEPAHHAPDETVEQPLEGLRVGRTDAMELRTVLLQGIDPLQNQHVVVNA